MKHLSIIFAIMVMALSTMPVFLVDRCLFCENGELCEESGQDDGCHCSNCCSPFMHCSTCSGCTQPLTACIGTPIAKLSQNVTYIYKVSFISGFSSSIWKPPRA
ncbi:hypothetical protein [uncultured Prevotella sp.]|uniref:hypothetical protein n=1 Tax=uncultured Prevotella sp. TaxID=159272 RepID=UPI0025CBEFFB|nr:hypothetical protein [uncultured Prevotella sp.]